MLPGIDMPVKRIVFSCFLLILLPPGPVRGEEGGEDRNLARQHYREGTSHYHKGNYRQAVQAFSRALKLASRPATLYSLALAHQKMNQLGEAERYYQRFLVKTPQASRSRLKQARKAAQRAVDRIKRAREGFIEGARQFRAKRYPEALAAYQGAYKLVPAPLLLYNMANTYLALERDRDAYTYFNKFLETPEQQRSEANGEKYMEAQAARDQLVRELDINPAVTPEDEGALSPLTLGDEDDPTHKDEAARVRQEADEEHGAEQAEPETEPDTVTAQRHAKPAPVYREAAAEPRAADPPGQSPGLRTFGWVTFAAGLAGLGAGAILGGLAIAKGKDLDTICQNGTCPPSAWDDVDQHNLYRYATTGTLLGGAALAAIGIVLVVTHPVVEVELGEVATVRPSLSVTGLGLNGHF